MSLAHRYDSARLTFGPMLSTHLPRKIGRPIGLARTRRCSKKGRDGRGTLTQKVGEHAQRRNMIGWQFPADYAPIDPRSGFASDACHGTCSEDF